MYQTQHQRFSVNNSMNNFKEMMLNVNFTGFIDVFAFNAVKISWLNATFRRILHIIFVTYSSKVNKSPPYFLTGPSPLAAPGFSSAPSSFSHSVSSSDLIHTHSFNATDN